MTLRFHDFSDHILQGRFPDIYEQPLGRDRTLFLSWQARVSDTNTNLKWADIADGKYDERFVRTAARRVKAYGEPMFIGFDIEFDRLTGSKGPVSDYVRAYRHIWRVFEDEGVDNVAWAWVPTGYVGYGNDQRMLDGYPGDKFVDWVGYDPYNFYKCNGTSWKTFEQTISRGYNWLKANGLGHKPIILSEYGTQYDANHPNRSKKWYQDIPEVLKRYPNLKGLVRFDSNGVFYGGGSHYGTRCGLYINNGPGMKNAFKNAGLDPYLNTRNN